MNRMFTVDEHHEGVRPIHNLARDANVRRPILRLPDAEQVPLLSRQHAAALSQTLVHIEVPPSRTGVVVMPAINQPYLFIFVTGHHYQHYIGYLQ
jgi:hypothetical protein